MYYKKKRKQRPKRNARILQITSAKKENVKGFMEWTFLNEDGNDTNYPSFDVFLGRSTKMAYLYKDLSKYYKNKYPQAGVKTVVVSYIIAIN